MHKELTALMKKEETRSLQYVVNFRTKPNVVNSLKGLSPPRPV